MNIFKEGMEKVHAMFEDVKARVEGEDRAAIQGIHDFITLAADEMVMLKDRVSTLEQRLAVRFAEFQELPGALGSAVENTTDATLGVHDDEQTTPAAGAATPPDTGETAPAGSAADTSTTPAAEGETPASPAADTNTADTTPAAAQVPPAADTPAAETPPATPPADGVAGQVDTVAPPATPPAAEAPATPDATEQGAAEAGATFPAADAGDNAGSTPPVEGQQ